jgi:hypothetical protein
LDRLLQPGNRAEELESHDNELIVMVCDLIRTGLAQADPHEPSGLRDRTCRHSRPAVKVTVVLAAIDFRPRRPGVRALDQPALLMMDCACPDRVVHWLDPEGFEVIANPLSRFVLRLEIRKLVPEAGSISRGAGANAIRGDLDGVRVV